MFFCLSIREWGQKLSHEERKERNHRLCSRGGFIESVVPKRITMPEEDAKAFLRLALTSEEAREFLRKRAPAHTMTGPRVCVCGCGCETRDAESGREMPAWESGNDDQTSLHRFLSDAWRCNALEEDGMRGGAGRIRTSPRNVAHAAARSHFQRGTHLISPSV